MLSPLQAQVIQAQIAVTRGDMCSRAVSFGIAALLSAFYCDWRFTTSVLVLYLSSEVLGRVIYSWISRSLTRLNAAVLLFNNMIGSAIVTALPVGLSATGDPIASALALAILVMSLVHIIMIRSTWRLYGLAAAAPILFGIVLTAGLILRSAGVEFGLTEMVVIGGMCGVSVYYIVRCVIVVSGLKTSLMRSTEAAHAANEAKSRFVAVVSHELRTSLHAICGIVQLLKTDKDAAQYDDRVSLLDTSSGALHAILDDLLDHAKLEAGRFDLVPQPGDMYEFLHQVVETFRAPTSSKGLELSLDLGDGLPRFAAFDAQRMRQVVCNLVSNAVKYTDTGGVTVSADAVTEEGAWRLVVTVADSGQGISEAHLHGLFQDYARLGGAEQSGVPGTGLGLVISRGLARLMDGDITVSSEVGRGSKFTFTACLAAADPPVTAPAPVAGAGVGIPALADVRRILVADDLRANRLVLCGYLKAPDLEIVEVADGIQALAALCARPFDLAILDMQMPGLTGAEVFTALRSSGGMNRTTPVFCLTGDAEPAAAERCLAMGMAGYLTKPVRKDVLREAIASVSRTQAA